MGAGMGRGSEAEIQPLQWPRSTFQVAPGLGRPFRVVPSWDKLDGIPLYSTWTSHWS